jgi:hypothetical protein
VKHGLRLFENRVLRQMFGPKRDKVIGNWTKFRNEEPYGLSALPTLFCDQINKNEIGWVCGTTGERRGPP